MDKLTPSSVFNKIVGYMTAEDMLKYLHELNSEMKKEGIEGEILLVGGAVMCLVLGARTMTKDIDALFEPKSKLYQLSHEVAKRNSLPADWLNDSVKGFISDKAEYYTYRQLSNLRINTVTEEYLLAMKCLALREGAGSSDVADILFLLKRLQIKDFSALADILLKYYPERLFTTRHKYRLEELLIDAFA